MLHDRSKDRRVRKTQDLLHGALASLIHEKSYDAIVVKEILTRANVGRSTFYTHFRDKDELLDSGIRDVLHATERTAETISGAWAERVLRFSLPILVHIEQYRATGNTSVDARAQVVVHEHLQRVLIELIADDLRRAGQRYWETRQAVPSNLLAQHVASAFVLVLNWWAASSEPLPASDVNDVYRALVLPVLIEVLD